MIVDMYCSAASVAAASAALSALAFLRSGSTTDVDRERAGAPPLSILSFVVGFPVGGPSPFPPLFLGNSKIKNLVKLSFFIISCFGFCHKWKLVREEHFFQILLVVIS